jgi:hypothetical protein
VIVGARPRSAGERHKGALRLVDRVPRGPVRLIVTNRRLLVLATGVLATRIVTSYVLEQVAEVGVHPLPGREEVAVRFTDGSVLVRPEAGPHQAQEFVKAFRSLSRQEPVAGFVDPVFLDLERRSRDSGVR